MKKYVSYIRVSTQRQDYGLEAQQKIINEFVSSSGGIIVKSFSEKVSGSKNNRKGLCSALNHCRLTGSTLIVGKLDRLSRSASFIMDLQNTDIDFICADNANINKMTISILAVVAENERDMISKRTKEGLAVAKSRGVKLGVAGKKNLIRHLEKNKDQHKIGNESWVLKSKDDSEKYRDVLLDVISSGTTSLYGISNELNKRGIRTSRGGKWYPTSVKNQLDRLEITP